MNRFFCWTFAIGCLVAFPILSLAQQTDRDNKSESSSSKVKSKDDQQTTSDSKEGAESYPEETQEDRRQRLRRNVVQGVGSPTSLLTMPRILREIQLSERQIKNIKDEQKMMRIRLQTMYRGVRDLPKAEQPLRMAELKPDADRFKSQGQKKILSVLTDEQRERLWGISMQLRGPIALLDPEVAELLELTDEQIEEIMQIAEEMDRELQTLAKKLSSPEALKGPPRGPVASKLSFASIKAKAVQKMEEVLTDKQREKYRALQGESFDFEEAKSPTPVESPDKTETEKTNTPNK